MKLLVVVLFTILTVGGKSGLEINAERVVLTIDRSVTKHQLEQFKNDLWGIKKIKMDVVAVEYGPTGKINFLKIAIDCNDGFKGEVSSTFLHDSQQVGFYRNYNDAENPFEIGSIQN